MDSKMVGIRVAFVLGIIAGGAIGGAIYLINEKINEQNNLREINKTETGKTDTNTGGKIIHIKAIPPRQLSVCDFGFDEIVYVDVINTQNCYALKTIESDDDLAYNVNRSLVYSKIGNIELYYAKQNIVCGRYKFSDKVWCLRDNSTCLKLEDNDKICSIIKLK